MFINIEPNSCDLISLAFIKTFQRMKKKKKLLKKQTQTWGFFYYVHRAGQLKCSQESLNKLCSGGKWGPLVL